MDHDLPCTACSIRRLALDLADRRASVQTAQDEGDAVQQPALAEGHTPAAVAARPVASMAPVFLARRLHPAFGLSARQATLWTVGIALGRSLYHCRCEPQHGVSRSRPKDALRSGDRLGKSIRQGIP